MEQFAYDISSGAKTSNSSMLKKRDKKKRSLMPPAGLPAKVINDRQTLYHTKEHHFAEDNHRSNAASYFRKPAEPIESAS